MLRALLLSWVTRTLGGGPVVSIELLPEVDADADGLLQKGRLPIQRSRPLRPESARTCAMEAAKCEAEETVFLDLQLCFNRTVELLAVEFRVEDVETVRSGRLNWRILHPIPSSSQSVMQWFRLGEAWPVAPEPESIRAPGTYRSQMRPGLKLAYADCLGWSLKGRADPLSFDESTTAQGQNCIHLTPDFHFDFSYPKILQDHATSSSNFSPFGGPQVPTMAPKAARSAASKAPKVRPWPPKVAMGPCEDILPQIEADDDNLDTLMLPAPGLLGEAGEASTGSVPSYGAEEMEYVCRCLRRNTSVTQLNASMNRIGDAGARHVAALLAETPQLPLARDLEDQALRVLATIQYRAVGSRTALVDTPVVFEQVFTKELVSEQVVRLRCWCGSCIGPFTLRQGGAPAASPELPVCAAMDTVARVRPTGAGSIVPADGAEEALVHERRRASPCRVDKSESVDSFRCSDILLALMLPEILLVLMYDFWTMRVVLAASLLRVAQRPGLSLSGAARRSLVQASLRGVAPHSRVRLDDSTPGDWRPLLCLPKPVFREDNMAAVASYLGLVSEQTAPVRRQAGDLSTLRRDGLIRLCVRKTVLDKVKLKCFLPTRVTCRADRSVLFSTYDCSQDCPRQGQAEMLLAHQSCLRLGTCIKIDESTFLLWDEHPTKIAQLELLAVLQGLLTFPSHFRGRKVVCWVDNMAALMSLVRGRSDSLELDFMRIPLPYLLGMDTQRQ
eukprot:s1644_g10.t1